MYGECITNTKSLQQWFSNFFCRGLRQHTQNPKNSTTTVGPTGMGFKLLKFNCVAVVYIESVLPVAYSSGSQILFVVTPLEKFARHVMHH